MASTNPSSRTEPKGRATRPRNANVRSSRISPMVQWIAIVVILSAIIGVLLYLGRDVRSTVGFIGATITDTEPLLNN